MIMSMLQSNNSVGYRWFFVAFLLLTTTSASAVIVVESDGVYSPRLGHHFSLGYPGASGNANYMMLRSHAWRQYRRSEPRTGKTLVTVPYSGSLIAVSSPQLSVRNHVARAQAYRLGDRW